MSIESTLMTWIFVEGRVKKIYISWNTIITIIKKNLFVVHGSITTLNKSEEDIVYICVVVT